MKKSKNTHTEKARWIKKYFNQREKLSLKNHKYLKQVKFLTDFILSEDLGKTGDLTTKLLVKNRTSRGYIIAKQDGIIAGLEEIKWFATRHKLSIKLLSKDGDKIKKGQKILLTKDNIHKILKLERTILNILQRMSGIATQTNKMVTKNGPLIVPTRKTQWGLLDKKAVVLGGGGTHRLGLYDWILIKDNHLPFIEQSAVIPKIQSFWEIEADSLKQALKFAAFKPNAILLDNFTPEKARTAAKIIRSKYPDIIIELSGMINEKNLKQYQTAKIDVISLGSLTHSVKVMDLGLDIVK